MTSQACSPPNQPPPRQTRPYPAASSSSSYQSQHHSLTLPDISYNPHLLGCFSPTALVRPLFFSICSHFQSPSKYSSPELRQYQATSSIRLLPLYFFLLPPAVAAYAHSISVGKR